MLEWFSRETRYKTRGGNLLLQLFIYCMKCPNFDILLKVHESQRIVCLVGLLVLKEKFCQSLCKFWQRNLPQAAFRIRVVTEKDSLQFKNVNFSSQPTFTLSKRHCTIEMSLIFVSLYSTYRTVRTLHIILLF